MSDLASDARGWIVEAVTDGDARVTKTHGRMEADPIRPGFSDVGTHNLLSFLTLSLRPRRVLEIGTHIGTAAVLIASALRSNRFGKLYTIEPKDLERSCAQDYVESADLTEYVEFIGGFSYEDVVRSKLRELSPFEIIFIDGSHEYADIAADIDFCYLLLRDNGFLILHDVGQKSNEIDPSGRGGSRRAMADFLEGHTDAAGVFFEYPLWLNPCGAGLICKQRLDPRP